MSSARENILNRLREKRAQVNQSPEVYLPDFGWNQEQKIELLTERMQAVRTEVHRLSNRNWIDWLNRELPQRGLHNVLVGSGESGHRFTEQADTSLQVKTYDQSIDDWKAELFEHIDVGLTSTLGGIAETGSLMLWPDVDEPRLMSLVPPVHIALLDADSIYESFARAMDELNWAQQMPTNALLISGPSKTADIEQTLAYGIHGPRQLIVLILG